MANMTKKGHLLFDISVAELNQNYRGFLASPYLILMTTTPLALLKLCLLKTTAIELQDPCKNYIHAH